MNSKHRAGIYLLLLTLTTSSVTVSAQDSFLFLATGDLPYSPEQDAKYRRLLEQSEGEDFEFF